MGNVVITAKIYADDPASFEDIKSSISRLGRLADSRIEDVGFGAKVLKVLIVMPDTAGGDIEEKLKAIKGVSQVQVEDVSLMA
ncbi:Elongation factor 1-beta [uncultured archaeon]|nr:Elongation factor 1-beta [uncultured archaeon]